MYIRQRELFGNKALFRHYEAGLYLYYHVGRGAWTIADEAGGTCPYAFIDSKADTPGLSKRRG